LSTFARKLHAVLALCTLVLSATVRGSAATPPTPLVLDVVLSMTGPGAALGRDESQALDLYEKRVNATGGINGQPVHFEIHDDQTTPQVAVQLTNTILQKNPNLILGSSLVASCAAMAAQIATAAVQLCFSPAFAPKPGSYSFGSSVSVEHMMPPQMTFLRSKNYTRIAVLSTSDASGQASERGLDDALMLPENHDLKVVAREHFAVSDLSVAAQVSRIGTSGAQIVFVNTSGTALGTALHGLSDAGSTLPVVAGTGAMNINQLTQYAAFVPAMLLFPTYEYLSPAKAGALKQSQDELYSAFRAAGVRPTPLHTLAWDPAVIAVTALRRLGANATAAQIHDYIENTHDLAGVNGVYDFRTGDQHGLSGSTVLMARWDPKALYWEPASLPGGLPLPASR
jgi:branched-chain amino acid transport system substrate-binding protein